MAATKKTDINIGEDIGIQEPLYVSVLDEKWYSHNGKLKMNGTWPNYTRPGDVWSKNFTSICIVALSTIPEKQTEPRHSPRDDYKNKTKNQYSYSLLEK